MILFLKAVAEAVTMIFISFDRKRSLPGQSRFFPFTVHPTNPSSVDSTVIPGENCMLGN